MCGCLCASPSNAAAWLKKREKDAAELEIQEEGERERERERMRSGRILALVREKKEREKKTTELRRERKRERESTAAAAALTTTHSAKTVIQMMVAVAFCCSSSLQLKDNQWSLHQRWCHPVNADPSLLFLLFPFKWHSISLFPPCWPQNHHSSSSSDHANGHIHWFRLVCPCDSIAFARGSNVNAIEVICQTRTIENRYLELYSRSSVLKSQKRPDYDGKITKIIKFDQSKEITL